VPHPRADILEGDGINGECQGLVASLACYCGEPAKNAFDLGPRYFDRVVLRRVWRQVKYVGTGGRSTQLIFPRWASRRAAVLRMLALLELLGAADWLFIQAGFLHQARWADLAMWITSIVVIAASGLRGAIERRPATAAAVALGVALLFLQPRAAVLPVLLLDAWLLALWVRGQGGVERHVLARPARSLVLSFVWIIVSGTLLLWLPVSTRGGHAVPMLDAFFTAVSAVCVTGLVTLDTATTWSSFGLVTIAALIQLGALGVMVIAGAMTLAVGHSLGAQRGAALGSLFDEQDAEELRRLVRAVVLATLSIEAVGALALWPRFALDMPVWNALGAAAFHAVSAFCNAGFALFSDSLVRYAGDPVVTLTHAILITLGGLGFGVLLGLWRLLRTRARLSVHAKLVLSTSALLVAGGFLLFFFFEYDRSLARLGLGGKLLAALTQSVTTRTAGFNSVSMTELHPVSLLSFMSLMFIGASPGSTGGGIKTTTFALVALAGRAFLRESSEVEVFGHRIIHAQVLRAFALLAGAALVFALGLGALLVTQELPFVPLAFETVSALGTVGLSLDLTPQLDGAGRLIVAALMFLGRVGPLTAAAALAAQAPAPPAITLPAGKVVVG
jgi:trk system potassium uptake protein TrkH